MMNHSFAVLAYKESPYLARCLDSLLDQTVKSEIYISTSTPSSYIDEIAGKYNLKVFTTAHAGIANDWNFGLSAAGTKYVTLAHQDDEYVRNYTESCLAASEKFKDTLICFTDYTELINETERANTNLLRTKRRMHRLFMPIQKNIKNKFWKKLSLSFGAAIPCPSVMYNKEMLVDFKFSTDFKINMDWDAWIRLSKRNGRFVYVPEKLLKHRIHTASATTAGIQQNIRQTEDLKLFNQLWPSFIGKWLAKKYSKSYQSNTV
jgi:glycosyltransferase involved in cell wall biosynthesis